MMTLELTRVDYTLTGLTHPRCMKLLPPSGTKSAQKVVIGGKDGTLQAFSLKKGEIQLSFKTLPGESITTVHLGSALGTIQDKIFISLKNEVRGFTKKGKLFLGFDTNLTESIKTMCVSGNDLLVTGSHVYNHYKDCKDANSYLCGDDINDLAILSIEKTHRLTPVLACEDRTLKVLDRSNLYMSLPLPNTPTTLSLFNGDGGDSGEEVIYAMQNGEIGLVQLSRAKTCWKWVIPNNKNRDAVQCMHWYDLTRDGVPELIVGREDGSIQVYSQPFEPLNDSEPLVEKFNYVCNESVTSIQGGTVGNPAFEEIVATTYTGWFFGLTTEVLVKQVSSEVNSNMALKVASEDKLKIDRLRSDIDEIEQKVLKEREKYQISTKEDSVGFSTIPLLNINDKIVLLKDDSVFQLTIETEATIDNVLLQSDVEIKLLDVEKNSAVVSHSICHPNSGNKLLATYRCQVNTTKINIILQFENGSGVLNVYITPHVQPKATHLRSYPIKRLCLYTRIHDVVLNRVCHILSLKGSFSIAEMHTWLSHCLPELPVKTSITDVATYIYKSTLLGSILQISYSKGEAEFKSDNITTISILKDFLTIQGTKKKINLDISFVINDDSMCCSLEQIYPKLKKEIILQNQYELLETLKDIELNESDSIQNLTPHCRKVLAIQNEIFTNISRSRDRFLRLEGVFITLLIDWFRFKNINAKGKITLLKKELKNCSLEDLLKYFEVSTNSNSIDKLKT